MIEAPIYFGRTYRDTVTGIEGVATAITEWMNGCRRVCLERADKDGKLEELWFDEQRLEDPTGAAVASTAMAGGTRPAPPRTGTGRR